MKKEIDKFRSEGPKLQREVTIFNRFWDHVHDQLERIGLLRQEHSPDAEILPGEYPTKNLPHLSDNTDPTK